MNDITRTTITRIISAVVALPVYIFAFTTDIFNSIPVLLVSIIISLYSLYEFYNLCNMSDEGRPFKLWGILAGIVVNVYIYLLAFGQIYGFIQNDSLFVSRAILIIIVLFLSLILVLQVFTRPIKGGIYSVAVTIFGVLYIVLFFSHIILLKSLENGFYYILILNIVVMLNDSGAYFGGVLLGKHKTGFEVSPNKSWEGYIAGLVTSALAMVVTSEIFKLFYDKDLFSFVEAVILGIILGIMGNVGDLIESAMKRDSKIKDSGSIIPGHGGMWDVFDALIFTFPFFYYYLILKGAS